MSSSNPTPPSPAAETPTTTTDKKGPLGLDFNDPLTLGGVILAGGIISYFGINFVKNTFFRPLPPPQQQPPPRRIPRANPEEIRQKRVQQELDLRNQRLTEEQQYYENLKRGIEGNTNNIRPYNIHRNFVEEEQDIDVIDDNEVLYNNQVFKQQIRENKPKPVENQKLVYNQPDDSLLMTADEIDDVNIQSLPAEFVNVGNRETEFDNIRPVYKEQQQKEDEDIYDLNNLEISEEDLKKMEANAYNNYY